MSIFVSLCTVVLCGILWHLGGQGYKWCRLIVGLCIALTKLLITHALLCLAYAIVLPILVSAFSYGLKSPIHRFWVWILKEGADGSCPEVEFATRATCGFIWSLGGIVFCMAGGNYLYQLIYSVFSMFAIGFLGIIQDVNVSEVGTGEVVALSIFI